jgi:hypothetical protein
MRKEQRLLFSGILSVILGTMCCIGAIRYKASYDHKIPKDKVNVYTVLSSSYMVGTILGAVLMMASIRAQARRIREERLARLAIMEEEYENERFKHSKLTSDSLFFLAKLTGMSHEVAKTTCGTCSGKDKECPVCSKWHLPLSRRPDLEGEVKDGDVECPDCDGPMWIRRNTNLPIVTWCKKGVLENTADTNHKCMGVMTERFYLMVKSGIIKKDNDRGF